MKPLTTQKERDALQQFLASDKIKINTHVLSASRVTVTVHESKDGHQLDQGSFYRKLSVTLDDIPQPDLPGPEIVGRVQGDIQIGGSDDQGKIRFKSFPASTGRREVEVELSTDAKIKLKTFTHDPAWLKVNLREGKEFQGRRTWRLDVSVDPNTPGARSFEEPNAVTLQIGDTNRFVRIPIEGHVSGR